MRFHRRLILFYEECTSDKVSPLCLLVLATLVTEEGAVSSIILTVRFKRSEVCMFNVYSS